ncbi:cyanate permease [Cutibacterium sp.]|uniref:cyanate permease n=1 Tax=Cutibacterium sp. TaxID=1912221 RepID=UPI0026DB2235|nr:cyanate permease [Cutibacterium sp.]MDO4412035.1 cyanate permease [Cutibacterium sp.]
MTHLARAHATNSPIPSISKILAPIYRAGLVWAAVGGLSTTAVTTVVVTPHSASALSGLFGTAIGVAFLACGREVHLLDRTRSVSLTVGFFIVQIAVLGGLAAILVPYRTGLLPIPCATSATAVALAWTVGIVVAGRRPQRIYEDPQGQNYSHAETSGADGGRR